MCDCKSLSGDTQCVTATTTATTTTQTKLCARLQHVHTCNHNNTYKPCCVQDCDMSKPVTTSTTPPPYKPCCVQDCNMFIPATTTTTTPPYKPCRGQDSDMDVHTCTRVVILRANWGEKCLAWCQPKSPKSGSSITPQTWVSSSCNQPISQLINQYRKKAVNQLTNRSVSKHDSPTSQIGSAEFMT